MPDTTPNYGWRIPKADGTDLIVPDDVRVPVTSIDTQMKAEENARINADNTEATNRTNGDANTLTQAQNADNHRITATSTYFDGFGGNPGKRIHFRLSSGGITNAAGQLTVAHGAPFTPSAVFVTMQQANTYFGVPWGVDSIGATNVQVRFMHSNGGPLNALNSGPFAMISVE